MRFLACRGCGSLLGAASRRLPLLRVPLRTFLEKEGYVRRSELRRFAPETVSRMYRRDGLDPNKWYLVYNSPTLGRFLWMIQVAYALPAVVAFHYFARGDRFLSARLRALSGGRWTVWSGLGVLAIVVFSLGLLTRIRRTWMARIYLSREDPRRFLGIWKNWLNIGTKFEFGLADVRAARRPEESVLNSLLMRDLFAPDFYLRNRGWMIRREHFRQAELYVKFVKSGGVSETGERGKAPPVPVGGYQGLRGNRKPPDSTTAQQTEGRKPRRRL